MSAIPQQPPIRHWRLALLFAFAALGSRLSAQTEEVQKPDVMPGAVPAASGVTITVTASRVTPLPENPADQPARTVTLTRAQIVASGAATLGELLQREAGIDLIDQTGNGRETTLSLRGQSDKRGVSLLVGGVPMNAVDDHRADLFLIPLGGIESIDIYFGSAPYGAGNHGAVVSVTPRTTNGLPMADLTLGVSALDVSGDATTGGNGADAVFSAGARIKGWDIGLNLERHTGEGFRDNGGFHETYSQLAVHKSMGAHAFNFSAGSTDSRYGEPGALTRAEMATGGREQSPFNRPDFSDTRSRRAGLSFSGPIALPNLRYKVDGYFHHRKTDTLSTGRFAASPFGYGLYTQNRQQTSGSAGEISYAPTLAPGLVWFAGYEFSREAFDLSGFTRDKTGAPVILFGALSDENSRADARWRNGALTARITYKPMKYFNLEGTFRRDSDRLEFRDELQSCHPAAGIPLGGTCARSFTANSYRIGAVGHPAAGLELFISQSRGFSLPSVFDLYAFPLFGSNPDLNPERSLTREAGVRWKAARGGMSATGFETRFDNEIQFVLTDPLAFVGENVNVGRSLRRGVELEGHFKPCDKLQLSGAVTLQDAEFQEGASVSDFSVFPPVQRSIAGNAVPLVPRRIYRATLQYEPIDHLRFGLNWRARSSSVLSNDLDNARAELGYKVPASQRWDWSGSYDAAHWRFDLNIRNLGGSRDENRGITSGVTDYYTPVAPREIAFAVTMKMPW